MIAAVHLPAVATIPVGLALAVWIMWYWKRLGSDRVPDSRRRIRRASILVMLPSLPLLVAALSFIDARTSPRAYVVTWLLVLFAIGLVLATAGLDLINTARIQRRERQARMLEAAAALAEAAKTARRRKPAEAGGGGPKS
ncbi:MAG: hypothetical protein ACYS0G_01785 [Planctomycetota bacterium]|jgi:hypothetical protein